MATGPWVLTDTTRTKISNGTFASTSSWKVALFQSTANVSTSSTTFAGLTNQVANANGYTTGGATVTINLAGTTSVTWTFASNPSWTATGGNIVARWAVMYKVSGDVFAFCLLDAAPADVTTLVGNTLTIDSDGVPQPLLTMA